MQRDSVPKTRSDDLEPLPVDRSTDPQPIAADDFRRLRFLVSASHPDEPETIEELKAHLDLLRSEVARVRNGESPIDRRTQPKAGKGKKERSR